MRTSSRGWNQVHIAFTHRRAFRHKGQGPGSTLALGKAFVAQHIHAQVATEHGGHQFAVQQLFFQKTAQTIVKFPAFGFTGFLGHQHHLNAFEQHGLAAQQAVHFTQWQNCGIKILGVGPHAHGGTLFGIAAGLGAHLQGLNHIATTEHQRTHLFIAHRTHFKPGRQSIGHRNTHTMQATREPVGATISLVELATRMQAGEHQLNNRNLFFRVKTYGYTPALVLNRNAAVGMNGHRNS